jgi:hypothetical protein
MITKYENLTGEKMVKIEHEDSSVTCYTEQQYADYLTSQAEQSTPIVTDEAKTK